jgi:hypothetical protein
MEEKQEKRTEKFRWRSRYDLYSYFSQNFSLTRKDVDREIYAVMATFKPRKGKAIETVELWQKVGMNLELQYTPSIEVRHLDH